MSERGIHGDPLPRARILGATFAALTALLAAGSWFDHLERLQQRLRLEAIEMVQLADALSAGPAELPRLSHLLDQRLPHPTGFCKLRANDGRLLLQRGSPSGLATLSAGHDAASPGWLVGQSRSPLTGINGVSSVSLEQAVVLWAGGNLVPGILILGAGLLMLTALGRLETAHVELRRSSRHALQDALTGLPNRRAFDAAFQRLGRTASRCSARPGTHPQCRPRHARSQACWARLQAHARTLRERLDEGLPFRRGAQG